MVLFPPRLFPAPTDTAVVFNFSTIVIDSLYLSFQQSSSIQPSPAEPCRFANRLALAGESISADQRLRTFWNRRSALFCVIFSFFAFFKLYRHRLRGWNVCVVRLDHVIRCSHSLNAVAISHILKLADSLDLHVDFLVVFDLLCV